MNRGLRDHSPSPDTVAFAAIHEHRRDAARLRRGALEQAQGQGQEDDDKDRSSNAGRGHGPPPPPPPPLVQTMALWLKKSPAKNFLEESGEEFLGLSAVGSAASNQGVSETATSSDTPAVDFQSAQMLHSRLDKPACRMCANFRGEDCYVIYLEPFWQDVAVPGLEDLASRGRADAEFIYVCASCTGRLILICEWQIREIREMSVQNTTIMCRDASVQLLDKAHVLILAQLKRQCAMAMRHGPL